MDINVVISVDSNLGIKLDKFLDVITDVVNTGAIKNKQMDITDTVKEDVTEKVENEKKETSVSKDDIIGVLQALARKCGKSAAIELLRKYGATKVSGLKEENYEALVDEAERVL